MSNVVAEASPNLIPIGYKQTEVGVIPEDWEVKTIFELVNFQKCLFDDGDWIEAKHITNKGIRLIQTGNIGIGRYVEKDAKKYIFEESFETLKCKELYKGDLLICRLAEPAGRACVLPDIGEDKVITSVDVTIFRPSNEIANREFYNQYFSSSDWFKFVLEQVGGTTHKRISRGSLGKIPVVYPEPKEQTAIANALSDVDLLITELEKLITKKQAIKVATMQQLLTGRTRLPQFALREDGSKKGIKQSELGEIPEDWELVSLQNMAIPNGLVRGPFGGAIKKEHFTKNGYKVYEQRNAIYETINIGNYYINQQKFDELKRFSVSHNDFIVSCSGTIGRIYQIPKKHPKGVINQALLKITLNHNIDSKYFYHYFKWDGFQERIIDGTQGGAMKNLVGMAEFKQSLMPLQTIKDEQTSIATILSDIDEDIQALEQRLSKTRKIKQGMMQELLTGRTRLV
ncbi:restriction endonuclease subunit S [Gilliamella sp. CG16]|uniref:restriction endonuclease subunit S n=1 Tax=Gilliamella sp. CG16 TaxID=3351503 RepID=UPI00398697B1